MATCDFSLLLSDFGNENTIVVELSMQYLWNIVLQSPVGNSKRKLTAVCSHQTRIGNLDAHLI